MLPTRARPDFDFDSLQKRFVGRRLSLAAYRPTDKGAAGKAVEAALREDPMLSHLD